MPRLRSIGFAPAATALRPSRTIAWASTVAVVVPSPASSDVLDATSFSICAPMFSNLSFSSISFATDTPSFVTVGAPKLFSSTALRPFGPSVVLTAFARMFTPFSIRWRASSLKRTSLAAIFVQPQEIRLRVFPHISGKRKQKGLCGVSRCDFARAAKSFLDDGHHVFLAHDEELFAVDLHFGAAVLAEQDVVAHFHVERTHLTVLENLALTHGDDLALDRLLGRRIGDHDATGGRPLLFKALDDHSIVQRANLQFVSHSSNLESGRKVFENAWVT